MGNEMLPSYVGIIVNHEVRIPIHLILGGGFKYFFNVHPEPWGR